MRKKKRGDKWSGVGGVSNEEEEKRREKLKRKRGKSKSAVEDEEEDNPMRKGYKRKEERKGKRI